MQESSSLEKWLPRAARLSLSVGLSLDTVVNDELEKADVAGKEEQDGVRVNLNPLHRLYASGSGCTLLSCLIAVFLSSTDISPYAWLGICPWNILYISHFSDRRNHAIQLPFGMIQQSHTMREHIDPTPEVQSYSTP